MFEPLKAQSNEGESRDSKERSTVIHLRWGLVQAGSDSRSELSIRARRVNLGNSKGYGIRSDSEQHARAFSCLLYPVAPVKAYPSSLLACAQFFVVLHASCIMSGNHTDGNGVAVIGVERKHVQYGIGLQTGPPSSRRAQPDTYCHLCSLTSTSLITRVMSKPITRTRSGCRTCRGRKVSQL
jgi:hypothetical protein